MYETKQLKRQNVPKKSIFGFYILFQSSRKLITAHAKLIVTPVISLYLCSSTGNYHESLSDSKRATELQPAYLKAIVRGKH